VPADFDADGIYVFALFRPYPNTWYIRYSSGAPSAAIPWGGGSDIPVLSIADVLAIVIADSQ
jgi:hypothetical protein